MIAWGAGGFIAPPMVEGYINQFLPTSITTTTLGRYAVKIGTVLGLTYLVKKVLSNKEAFPVALGGSLYVVVSAVNEFVPQLTMAPRPTATLPPAGTSAYRAGMINAYRGGMIATGIGAYSKGTALGRALPGLARPLPGLAQNIPSEVMDRFNINFPGMENPVFADPRFVNSPLVAR